MNINAVDSGDKSELNLHATCVAFGAKGIVITGRSNSGKSSLALQLISIGAVLVSDDRTRITLVDGVSVAHAPYHLAGVIEARGIGLLQVPYQQDALVQLLVNLDCNAAQRLPEHHETNLLGNMIDTIYKVGEPYFPMALKALILGGRYVG